jgi:hypothetical protein
MTWEWSHAPEAYADARENLEDLDPVELQVIYAEWAANRTAEGPCREDDDPPGGGTSVNGEDFDEVRYAQALDEARGLTPDVLADAIWRHAEGLRNCTDGGWQAWVCPYGCHLVAMSREGR